MSSRLDTGKLSCHLTLLADFLGSAVQNWNHRELLLRLRLFKGTCEVPSCSFHLHTKDVRAFAGLSLTALKGFIPVPLLKDVSLDEKLVELKCVLSFVDLLDGSQERLGGFSSDSAKLRLDS